MANWLQNAANIVAIATVLVSWRGFIGLALAVAWFAVDRRHGVYNLLRLGTQMNRLQHEQFILVNEVLPDNYLRLTPAIRTRATGAVNRYVYPLDLCILDSFSFFSHSNSLNADVFDCHSRYLALPTLGWLEYAVEVFSLYISVYAMLRRLHEVRRELIEVCHLDLVFLLP
jgi:hypothetical protein